MDQLEQENQELQEEVNTLKVSWERFSNMVEALVAAQNQSSPNSQETIQRTMISKIVSTLVSVAPLSAPQYHMPSDFPWGMPHPMVHTTPYNEELIFHTAPSEGVGTDERMDEFQDQFSGYAKGNQSPKRKRLVWQECL